MVGATIDGNINVLRLGICIGKETDEIHTYNNQYAVRSACAIHDIIQNNVELIPSPGTGSICHIFHLFTHDPENSSLPSAIGGPTIGTVKFFR